jgi:aspartyl/asparaginyl beta-hydroxylase (cupin superfamily)
MEELWITEAPKEFDKWIVRENVDLDDVARIREGLEITASGSIAEVAGSGQTPEVYFPGLTSRPWWPREDFPWLDALESSADTIRDELMQYLAGVDMSVSHPTMLAPDGSWRALYLTCAGKPHHENRALFPRASEAVAAIPGASDCGMTYFSTIDGDTHIAPHSGFTNAHLRCHLSLVAVEGSKIRVADEWREWVNGKAFVFDDSFDHEVRNDGADRRTVLLLDSWHPDLSAVEKDALKFMMSVWRRMYSRYFWAEQLTSSGGATTPTGVMTS